MRDSSPYSDTGSTKTKHGILHSVVSIFTNAIKDTAQAFGVDKLLGRNNNVKEDDIPGLLERLLSGYSSGIDVNVVKESIASWVVNYIKNKAQQAGVGIFGDFQLVWDQAGFVLAPLEGLNLPQIIGRFG